MQRAHDERLDAPRRRGLRRVHVDRHEQVAARPVGDVGARLQVVGQRRAQRLVRLARINDLHARHSLLDQPPELQGHLQREVLFIDSAVMRPGEFSAVAGVDHDDLHAVRNISGP